MKYKSLKIDYKGHKYYFIAGEGMDDHKDIRVIEKFREQAVDEPETLETINNGPLVLEMTEDSVKRQVRSPFNNELYWVKKTSITEFEFSK